MKRYGALAGEWHSQLSLNERRRVFKNVVSGDLKLLVGARSALFLPFENLKLIIVDEEHDASYKQQEGFKFSARDIAIKRAQLIKIPIILGSATPSLRTLKLVEERKFKTISLTHSNYAVHREPGSGSTCPSNQIRRLR